MNVNKSVYLIAPSRRSSVKKIKMACKRLSVLKFDINFSSYLEGSFVNYWSESPENRIKDLLNAFLSNSDCIWSLNGGLASLELVRDINYQVIENNPKIFIGYSDITSIQLAIFHYTGMPSVQFYMPGVKDWISSKRDVKFMNKILKLENIEVDIYNSQIISHGISSAVLVGGCLDLVSHTLGTEYEIDTNGKILYLEDVGCSPQRLHNDLCHLYNAKKFDHIKGLVFAKMLNSRGYRRVIKLFVAKIRKDIPILWELSAGHNPVKIPIVIGSICTIDTQKKRMIQKFPDDFVNKIIK